MAGIAFAKKHERIWGVGNEHALPGPPWTTADADSRRRLVLDLELALAFTLQIAPERFRIVKTVCLWKFLQGELPAV